MSAILWTDPMMKRSQVSIQTACPSVAGLTLGSATISPYRSVLHLPAWSALSCKYGQQLICYFVVFLAGKHVVGA